MDLADSSAVLKLFRAAFDGSAGAAVLVDVHRRFIDVNLAGARLLGQRRDELVGASVDTFVHGRPTLVGHAVAAILRDGGLHMIEISARSIGRGRTIAHIREAHADDPHALSRTAHDLNNALVVVSAFATALDSRPNLPGEAREDLVHVLAATTHAVKLSRQLGTGGRHEPHSYAFVDLSVVIRGAASLLRGVLGPSVRFELRENAADTRLLADVTQLERLLVNLATNAREAMPDGGTFQLETRAATMGDKPCVVLVATDTGIGMDDETRKRALEHTFSTKGAQRGAGLGIVAAIVAQHFGEIEIASTVGKGTSFQIRLPLAQQDSRRA